MPFMTLPYVSPRRWIAKALTPTRCALAASIMAISLSAHSTENPTAKPDAETDDAARAYLSNTQKMLESQILPKVKQGVIELSTVHPASLAVWITGDPSPYHVAVTTDKRGAMTVQMSLGYLAMHDAALDAVAISSVLNRPAELRKYLRYQLAIARENETLTKHARTRTRAKTFAEFLNLEPSAVQMIYAQPQWRKERQAVGTDSLGWTVSYLLVLHERRLSGDGIAVPASASAAKLASAAGFFPAPPFATAYQLEEVTNPGQRNPPDRLLLCRAADFLDAGASVLGSAHEWRHRAAESETLRARIQKLRDDVARMRRDARCARRDATEA